MLSQTTAKPSLFALMLLLSGCAQTERDDSADPGAEPVSSSRSSSSASSPSSSSGSSLAPCVDGTVAIGTQTWSKCNLNVMHNSGNGESWCHGNQESNCDAYGRLYDWAAAMDLPSECNKISCVELIQFQHRGLCPEGFHIPTSEAWDALHRFVDGAGYESLYNSPTAGRYLNSKEGWNDCGPSDSGKSHVCEDAFGFSALPGGYRHANGFFGGAGYLGGWWSASEDYGGFAYSRSYEINYVVCGDSNKAAGLSVRCVQDSP